MERARELFEEIRKVGLPAIDSLILTRQSEELFLEFKRSEDDGRGEHLSQNDRKNLAKAISGFGNSEGGIIVWGISCGQILKTGDIASSKHPILDPQRFKAWLEGAISGCTVPPHSGIEQIIVTEPEGGKGFVVTLIPKSGQAPHQSINDNRYYIRSGSSFMPTPHSVLAGMFGKRPQPNVFYILTSDRLRVENQTIISSIEWILHNEGPGIAADLFFSLSSPSLPGPSCTVAYSPPDTNQWSASIFLRNKINIISMASIRLAPEAEIFLFKTDISMTPPFTSPFSMRGICGCGQSPPYRFQCETDSGTITSIYEEYWQKLKEGISKPEAEKYIARILPLSIGR
jgi:hypothetical protein